MTVEYPAETVLRAEELYCVDRLSFRQVSLVSEVPESTVKSWAKKRSWREKREQLARVELEMRADKIMARAGTVKALLENPRADMAFAVSSLETLALKEAEAARRLADKKRDEAQKAAGREAAEKLAALLSASTPEETAASLRNAVLRKLSMLLTRPEDVDLKAVRNVQRCFALIKEMEAGAGGEKSAPVGLSEDLARRIAAAMSVDFG